VDLSLRNNPTTRESWATARAAAATYGSARGEQFPSLDLSGNVTRIQTVASQGRSAVTQWVYGPSLSLSYLLLDFGGRSGRVENARQALFAANFAHNQAILDVVLGTETAYFNYVAQNALLAAQQATLREAETNLAAAEERRTVGVATIADVLQARTAASQAQLALEQTEGARQTARGALALALGYPANLPYDVDSTAAEVSVGAVADSVDSLIVDAIRLRPDLAQARAQLAQAQANVTAARGARLPSLNLSGTGGRTYTSTLTRGGNNYTLSLGLTVPLFNGFSREYDEEAARFEGDAAKARLDLLQQQAAFQVFSAYYALQTATRRVRTAGDLLASATQSLEAARARYKEGVGSVLDLLTAQTALADARAQQVQARLEWQISLAQLAHDTGLLDPRGGSTLHLTSDSTAVPNR
jgi:outer membrane protein TolC